MTRATYWSRLSAQPGRRRLLTGAASGGLALASAYALACGGGKSSERSSEEGVKGVTETQAAARRIGTLRFGQVNDLDTLDPTQVVQTPWRRVYGHMFDPLLHRRYKDGEPEIFPKLAVSSERVDDLTVVFKLRQGVKFHNNEPFDANSMLFTRQRMLDPTSQASGTAAETIDKFETVDPYTLKVITKFPDAFALDSFTDSSFPVPPKAYQEAGGTKNFGGSPIGSGPYALDSWKRGDSIVVKARPDHWGGMPLADKVIFRVIPELSTRADALLAKEVDIIEQVSPVQAQKIKESDSARLSVAPGSPQPIWAGLISDRPPLNDKRVRQAINYAVNKEAIVQRILQGYGEVMGQPCVSNTACHNPSVKPYPYDPKKAKDLLQAGGYSQIELSFQFSSGVVVGGKEVAQAIASDLAAVGIKVSPVDVERAVFLKDFTDGKGRHAGLGDIFVMYYAGGLRPEGVAIRRVLASSDSWNAEHYANKEVDDLIIKAQQTFDDAARSKLYQRIAEIGHEDVPWLFLYGPKSLWGVNKAYRWEAQPDDMLWVFPEDFPV